MEPGTDPADTPDSFLLRSLTTARSSDQDFRGTVLSGTACSPADSLLMVSIFSIRCRRPFREVIRTPASTSAAVWARQSCRRGRVPKADAGTPSTDRFHNRVTAVTESRARQSTDDTQDVLRARPRTAADSGRRRE